jgi:hypothetical protein
VYEDKVVMKEMVMENGPKGSHRKWLQGPTVRRLHPARTRISDNALHRYATTRLFRGGGRKIEENMKWKAGEGNSLKNKGGRGHDAVGQRDVRMTWMSCC